MTLPPSAEPYEDVDRVLIVTAHPDDVDFGAAGSVATWTRAGIEVAYCVATSGDAGGFDETPRAEMRRTREAEQRAAAAIVGVTDVTILEHPDGALYPTPELRRDITRVIRRFRPDRVVTFSPLRPWDRLGPSHGDHARLGEAAYDAVYPDARNQFAYPELLTDEKLEPWTVREVWFFDGPGVSHAVDITDVIDAKIAALESHASQIGALDVAAVLRGGGARSAAAAGLPDGRLAELFTIVRTG